MSIWMIVEEKVADEDMPIWEAEKQYSNDGGALHSTLTHKATRYAQHNNKEMLRDVF